MSCHTRTRTRTSGIHKIESFPGAVRRARVLPSPPAHHGGQGDATHTNTTAKRSLARGHETALRHTHQNAARREEGPASTADVASQSQACMHHAHPWVHPSSRVHERAAGRSEGTHRHVHDAQCAHAHVFITSVSHSPQPLTRHSTNTAEPMAAVARSARASERSSCHMHPWGPSPLSGGACLVRMHRTQACVCFGSARALASAFTTGFREGPVQARTAAVRALRNASSAPRSVPSYRFLGDSAEGSASSVVPVPAAELVRVGTSRSARLRL